MKKYLLLLLVILLAPTLIPSVKATPFILADDPHYAYEFNVGTYSYHYVYGAKVVGDGEYGTFTAHYDDITFFIVDQENFDKYVAGQSYSRYSVLLDVVEGSYQFRYPYADTWYRVFCNKDSLWPKDISFDLYYDRTPPDVTLNLDTGATYSGVKEINIDAVEATFSVYRITLYINGVSKKVEFYSDSLTYNWITTDYANGQYTVKVVVEDTVNNEVEVEKVVTIYNAPPTTTTDDPTTTGTTTSTTRPIYVSPLSTMLPVFILLAGVSLVIGAVVYARRGKDEPSPPTIPVKPFVPPPAPKPIPVAFLPEVSKPAPVTPEEPPAPKTIERTTVEKVIVLVICPYCGSKNEQGITKCANCQAEI
jgi:hypothetical protein